MNQLERREPEERLDKLAHAVIGAAIEVHRHLGPGYLESVYQAALEVELKLQEIPFEPQRPVGVTYKGNPVGDGRLDFLVDGVLVVERKAVDELEDVHKAQVISYLKATRLHLGLLINFNVTVLKNGVKRVIRSPQEGD